MTSKIVKLFQRAKPERTNNLIKMYDDSVRVERQPMRLGGQWMAFVKDSEGRFQLVGSQADMDEAIKMAKRAR